MLKEALTVVFCVLAAMAMVIAVGVQEVRADDQAARAAQADFRRDIAAAKVCKGEAFEWDGSMVICHREVRP